ncbi:MAG TPA: hypothetical protein VJH20_00660 [Candidatus Nanoarchaeia archaeon]|nr:hypothetical protein [Candidatus Nanoarchaeia archaeon]
MQLPSEKQVRRQASQGQMTYTLLFIASVVGYFILPQPFKIIAMLLGVFFLIMALGVKNLAKTNYYASKDREELRQAQLSALRRGNVKVKLRGKMRTLK